MSTKEQEVFRVATELFAQGPDWVVFFREILGLDGIIRKVYASPEAMDHFKQTKEYSEVQHLLARLREKGDQTADDKEPTRVITVRLPKSLHESLRTESHERKTSMNKLCISKLLQMVDGALVPADGAASAASARRQPAVAAV